MADFHQSGSVATLHRLGAPGLERLERELVEFSLTRPIALVLHTPALALTRPEFSLIVEKLKCLRYVRHIVLSLPDADRDLFDEACTLFSDLPQKTTILWNGSPRVTTLKTHLASLGLNLGVSGKGQSRWMAYGCILAEGAANIVITYDCDGPIYLRERLALLAYPVASPSLAFEFSKGYYAQDTDPLYSRVSRLLVTPLLRTLAVWRQPNSILDYLDSFRSTLAGEFAMNIGLVRVNRVASDGGLEIGTLAEVYRNTSPRRICQVELPAYSDRAHHASARLFPDAMAFNISVDISSRILRTLAAEGMVFSDSTIHSTLVRYQKLAEDSIDRYNAYAEINGLHFDRHADERMVETFALAIGTAGRMFTDAPANPARLIPNWNRVTAASPGFLDDLTSAVARDSAEARLLPAI